MYLKIIITCLLFFSIMHSMELEIPKKTKEHMLACCDMLEKGQFKEFKRLIKENKFYLYHLEDPILLYEGKSYTFYELLSSTAITYKKDYKETLKYGLPYWDHPDLFIELLKSLKSKTSYMLNKQSDINQNVLSFQQISNETILTLCKCYHAIQNNDVTRLSQFLIKNDFYVDHITHKLEVGSGFSRRENLLEIAIECGNPECIHSMACLQYIARHKEEKNLINNGQKRESFDSYIRKKYGSEYLIQLLKTYHSNKFSEQTMLPLISELIDYGLAYFDLNPLGYCPTAAIAAFITEKTKIREKDLINKKDIEGDTPLLHIMRDANPQPNVILWLLKNGAKVNIQGKKGNTALHIVTRCMVGGEEKSNYLYCIKLLLDFGADPHLQNEYHKTPIQSNFSYLSNKEDQLEVVRAIKMHPRIALMGQAFDIDPFKYSKTYTPNQYSHANTAHLIRAQQIEGKKHTYTKYKRRNPSLFVLLQKPQKAFSSNIHAFNVMTLYRLKYRKKLPIKWTNYESLA